MAINIGTKMVIQEDTVRRADQSGQKSAAEKIRVDREDRQEKIKLQEKEEARKAALDEQRKAADANTLNETKGKVISESKDGDTVRASEKSIEALNDGMVLPKGPEAAQNADVQNEDQEKAQNEVKNLNGYSEKQLDALYHQGKITLQERDKEIKKREEIKEAAGMETDQDKISKGEDDKKASKETRDSAVKSTAQEEEKPSAADEAKRENAVSDSRAETIKKENEAFDNFERTMNNVISVQARLNQDPDLERFGTVDGFNIVTK